MAFRSSRLPFRGRRVRPATQWLGDLTTTLNAAQNTTFTTTLVDTNAAYAISRADAAPRRVTVLRVRGNVVLYNDDTAADQAIVHMGIIEIPYTVGGVADATDFSPSAAGNMLKSWLWRRSEVLSFRGDSAGQKSIDVDVKAKRVLDGNALAFVMSWAQLVGATGKMNMVTSLRALVSRPG